MELLNRIGENAKAASRTLAGLSGAVRDRGLEMLAQGLLDACEDILAANAQDLEAGRQNGLRDAMLDRLRLTRERIEGMASGIREIIALPDPIGRTLSGTTAPNGLKIRKVTVPLGVIAIIYEARPNVTSDAAALCLKSGNAVVLRGGKEAIRSNRAIAECMRRSLRSAGIDENCIQLIEDTSRETAEGLMKLNDYIDVLIPRGGAGLIRNVVMNSTVPVIQTGAGNCHIYVDRTADVDMAAEIIFNAKTSRPSVCNACESLLIHRDIARQALPAIKARLDEKQVEIRGDDAVCEILQDAVPASKEDWGTEYLDYIISVKTVGSVEEAIAHINRYSTHHSECIVTQDYRAAQQFQDEVDSAAVYVNASTRFTDGGMFGFGAEIGIYTQKLHARGPLGLPELTTFKYLIDGNGQVR